MNIFCRNGNIILGLKLFIHICIGLWISQLHYCVLVFKALSQTMGGESVVTRHNWSNRQHIVILKASLGPDTFQFVELDSQCEPLWSSYAKNYNIESLAWNPDVRSTDFLSFSHPTGFKSSKFIHTNFSNRKYFPSKQKNLGVAPVLVQIISWLGTLSS